MVEHLSSPHTQTSKSMDQSTLHNNVVPFPDLPTELVREILESAAENSKSCLTLTLVSSAVRFWIIPIMYHNVVLRNAHQVKGFLHALSSAHTAQSPRLTPFVPLCQHVRQLAIFALGPLRTIEDVITRCTNVQRFACAFSLPSYVSIKLPVASVVHFPTQPREHHLLGLSCRDGIPWTLLGKDTTHLHIQISSLQVLLSLLQMHNQLPLLTHLALRIPSTLLATPYSTSLFFKSLQEYNESLQVILVLITDRSQQTLSEWDVATSVKDAKIVFDRASGSALSQWEDTCTLGNLWESANSEVDKRMGHDV
ncbi:hypothetical protein GYMLUDRAFT_37449 [Collybiopsis luxurians FD-317 M1]|nr:hypothetical protein GYMLUDRAFT_37449 [Collybiopsis luxurians FD-317 M1]